MGPDERPSTFCRFDAMAAYWVRYEAENPPDHHGALGEGEGEGVEDTSYADEESGVWTLHVGCHRYKTHRDLACSSDQPAATICR